MLRKLLLGVVIGAGSIVGVVGCDKAKETTAEKAKETADKAKEAADKAAKETADKAKEAADKAKEMGDKSKEAGDKVVAEMGKNVKDLQDSVSKDLAPIETKIKDLNDQAVKATGADKTALEAKVKDAGTLLTQIKDKMVAGMVGLKDNASLEKVKSDIMALIGTLKSKVGL